MCDATHFYVGLDLGVQRSRRFTFYGQQADNFLLLRCSAAAQQQLERDATFVRQIWIVGSPRVNVPSAVQNRHKSGPFVGRQRENVCNGIESNRIRRTVWGEAARQALQQHATYGSKNSNQSIDSMKKVVWTPPRRLVPAGTRSGESKQPDRFFSPGIYVFVDALRKIPYVGIPTDLLSCLCTACNCR